LLLASYNPRCWARLFELDTLVFALASL
jgi:hypothetical protein